MASSFRADMTLQQYLQREFPSNASEWIDPVGRRNFLKLMGASLALAGLSGCVIQPPEKVVPYVRQPEELIPGHGLFFATAFTLSGVATPLLVRSNEGRPTKVEGNPEHPSSGGSTATDIFSQASILSLYDPDRSQTPLYRGETRPWTAFVAEIRGLIERENDGIRARRGAGLRFLTETVTSPTLAAQMKQILTDFPEAKWHQYEPVNRDNARAEPLLGRRRNHLAFPQRQSHGQRTGERWPGRRISDQPTPSAPPDDAVVQPTLTMPRVGERTVGDIALIEQQATGRHVECADLGRRGEPDRRIDVERRPR